MQISDFTLSPYTRSLVFDKQSLFLRNKEFALLEYFMKNVGKVVTRSRILEDVWDRNFFCSTSTVDVHVSNLRRKIRIFAKTDPIKTVYCVGYIFDMTVNHRC